MSEIPESAPEPRARRARRVSAVPKEVVFGIDKVERNVSFFGGALALALAALFAPHLFKNTWVTDTAKPKTGHACIAPFHWDSVRQLCVHRHLTHPSAWLPQFILIVGLAIVIILFAVVRKRVGVAFGAFLLGLSLGSVGLPFLFLGAWLLIRALRLQRYGNASFAGSSKMARERARERAAERGATARTPRAARTRGKAASAKPSGPSPSKRYTPKKPARKR